MKHFYVITNNQKDPDRTTTERIRTYLEKRGCTCEVQEQSEQGDIHTDAGKIPRETQCILVLGGDGTILQASRDTVELEIPVIGVNLGTLGYLAEIEQNRLEEALDRLIQDDYELEKRMMLRGTIAGNEIDALNDIVISRKGSLRIIEYKVYVNNRLLLTFSADGVILATPTGSTGYNLSAGGPIVEPRAEIILVTPICAHTTNARTIVLSPEDVISVEIPYGRDNAPQEAEINFDGTTKVPFQTGERIMITCSPRHVEFVKLDQENFLQVLHKKMS